MKNKLEMKWINSEINLIKLTKNFKTIWYKMQ